MLFTKSKLLVLSHCVRWYREYKYRKSTTFEVLQALRVVNSKSEVSMEVILCILANGYQQFGTNCCLHLGVPCITSHKDAV
jgi:hypothetical protein